MSDKEELARYHESIQEAKGKIQQLGGRKDALLERLAKDHDLSSVKKAEAHLEDLKGKKKDLDEQFSTVMERIREKAKT